MRKTGRAVTLLLLASLVAASWSCRRGEDRPVPKTTAPAPSASTPGPAAPAAPVAAINPPPSAPVTGPGPSDCCEIVPDPERKGRLGRIVVKFPEGANPGSTRIDVFRPGEQTAVAGGYGAQMVDVLPGTYDVEVSRKRIAGVVVQSAHETRLRVGVLRINAGSNTRVDLLDRDNRALTGGFGRQEYGLPVGQVQVKVAGQAETVTISDGQITDF